MSGKGKKWKRPILASCATTGHSTAFASVDQHLGRLGHFEGGAERFPENAPEVCL
jgi:hypothetical protein